MFFWMVVPWLVTAILTCCALFLIEREYSKCLRVPNRRYLSGLEIVQYLLSANGVSGVLVGRVRGHLTDYYDHPTKTLCLSCELASSTSVAALASAAHEVGHAVQGIRARRFVQVRLVLGTLAKFCHQLGCSLFILALICGWRGAPRLGCGLAWGGMFSFAPVVSAALMRLIEEFDATRRALQLVWASGLVGGRGELVRIGRLLAAAALTYIVGLAVSLTILSSGVSLLLSLQR